MAEQIIAEYKLKVDEAVKNLNKVQSETKELDADLKKTGKDGQKSMDDIGKSAGGLSSVMKKLGGVIAAAFAVDRIIAFGKEAVRLAAQAEGIERAFRKLNNPNLLADLRRATRGTVSDLELMRSAVRANNFQIPLEKLATFFEFATKRSIETGESVDYLVNSIVDGIGRKSTLVLDNLGISAAQLQEEIKKTGDFGVAAANIIEQSLEQTGEVADTTAIKMAKFATSTENLQKAIGKILAEQASPFVTFLTNVSTALEKDITAIDRLRQELEGQSGLKLLANQTEEIAKLKDLEREATEAAGKVSDAEFIKLNEKVKKQREVVQAIQDELDKRADYNTSMEITVDMINKELESYDKRNKVTQESVRSIATLNAELKKLNEDFKGLEIGSDAWNKKIIEISKKTSELEAAMTKAQARLVMFQQAARGFDPFAVDEDEIDIAGGVIEYTEEVARQTDIADVLWENHFREQMRLQDEAFENEKKNKERLIELDKQRRQENLDVWYASLEAASTITGAVTSLVQAEYDRRSQALERQLENDEITREEYDRKRASLARSQFKKEKELRIIQASINTALGVTNAFATAPNIILGAILAAAVAAAGAAQIGIIASQPIPEFAEGGLVAEHGLLKGKTHAQGGILIEAERDEYFMPTKATKRNYGLLEAMRKGIEDQYIMKHYVPRLVDESLLNGFKDIGRSAELNGITANLKDTNLIAAIDRDRQSTAKMIRILTDEVRKGNRKNRDRYYA